MRHVVFSASRMIGPASETPPVEWLRSGEGKINFSATQLDIKEMEHSVAKAASQLVSVTRSLANSRCTRVHQCRTHSPLQLIAFPLHYDEHTHQYYSPAGHFAICILHVQPSYMLCKLEHQSPIRPANCPRKTACSWCSAADPQCGPSSAACPLPGLTASSSTWALA